MGIVYHNRHCSLCGGASIWAGYRECAVEMYEAEQSGVIKGKLTAERFSGIGRGDEVNGCNRVELPRFGGQANVRRPD
jgi:hypothetical protein